MPSAKQFSDNPCYPRELSVAPRLSPIAYSAIGASYSLKEASCRRSAPILAIRLVVLSGTLVPYILTQGLVLALLGERYLVGGQV